MKPFLRFLTLFLAWAALLVPGVVMGQTAALEFAAGAGNPTGNGPTVANQVITFQNNTNNPTGNTFVATTPPVTATYVLGPQTYNAAPNISTGKGTSFGATINNAAATAIAQPLFPAMNNPFNNYPNSTYTSGGAIPAGSGIDVAANNSVGLFNSVEAIPAGSSNTLTARYLFSRLTITFSQPIVNPVVHITDMGGNTGALGFTTDLDLVPATGVSLSQLSGPAPFEVTAGQIRNNSTTLPAANFTSGTARVTTPAAGITSIAFDLYVHGDGTGAWPAGAAGTHSGDLFFVGISVAPVADVATSITASTNRVVVGQPLRFDVTYTNAGPNEAAGYTQTLQLSAGLGAGNVSFTNLQPGVTATYDNNTGKVSFTGVPTTLASGANQNLTVNIAAVPNTLASVSASSTVSTTASQGADTGANSATSNVPVQRITDVATTLSGPTSATQGNEVTLNVATTNLGTVAAFNVAQTVQLVSGLTNVFVSNNGTYNSSNGLVTFPVLPTLSAGQMVGNYVSFAAPPTAFAPTAVVTPNTTATGDSNPANNTATLNGAAAPANIAINPPPAATQVANLYTTIISSVLSAAPGSTVTLTVVTGNNGPNTVSNVAETTQVLPNLNTATLKIGGATFTSQSGNNYTYANGAKYNSVTGLVTFATLTTLASSASASNTIEFTVPATANGQILPTAAVNSTSTDPALNTTDPVVADNFAATAITVLPTVDLVATITGPATAVVVNQPVTYTATFINNGPATATNAVATVQLPVGLTGVFTSQGSYNAATGLVTFPVQPTVLAGAGQSYTISFVPTVDGSYAALAAFSSNVVDVAPADNTAKTTTTVTPLVDVAVSLNVPATANDGGGSVTYVAQATNNGPSTANGVVTKIVLPVGATTPTFSLGGLYDTGTRTVTFPAITLASGASASYYVNFSNTSTANIKGSATVETSTNELVLTNNTDTGMSTSTSGNSIRSSSTSVVSPATAAPGSTFTITPTFSTTSNANGLVEQLNLPPGTMVNSVNGAITGYSYNMSTGVLTFANIALNNTSISYNVIVTAPATGPFTAISTIYSGDRDALTTDNSAATSTTISLAYDEATTITGPASALPSSAVTYTVQSVNNGPASTGTTGTVTQVVTLPAGTVVTNNGGGTVANTPTAVTITFPAVTNQAVGSVISNSFTATMPTTGNLPVSVATTATGETGPAANNSASLTTTQANQAPVAANVVNALQTPQGSTAGQLPISSLVATDADGTIAGYQLTSIPDAATQGTLYYSNGGTYTAITTATQALTPAQAASLKFDPITAYVGNVFFGYTATDNSGNVSLPALYTIQVGQDNAALYGTTPVKGGTATNGLTK